MTNLVHYSNSCKDQIMLFPWGHSQQSHSSLLLPEFSFLKPISDFTLWNLTFKIATIFDPNSVESRRFCGGKMRDCGGMGMEEEMESEMSRRVLVMQKRYISYDTLKRDLVPCDTPGDSYYNCKGPAASHPYSRGCEIITRCARGEVSDINS
ncbi:uncharacterized protein LOC116001381 [Ipomoea triloba]|uniref:uncharacterized protein LOC116001381 n=1 Tax=Ipomoea triloba TaxID=35885 RepID=UPI00125D3740|nr:uncharacterized protein LOC116001381 [Ipomoea triloba]